jgi:TRAP-type mannitol/chloroaromatic compound transport system permease small subunit
MSNAEWWVCVVALIIVVGFLQAILQGVKLILKKLDKMTDK